MLLKNYVYTIQTVSRLSQTLSRSDAIFETMGISSDIMPSLRLKDPIPDSSCVFCVRVDFESEYQERVSVLRRRNGIMAGTQAAMIPDDSSSIATTVIGVTPSAHISVGPHVCN